MVDAMLAGVGLAVGFVGAPVAAVGARYGAGTAGAQLAPILLVTFVLGGALVVISP